MKITYIYLQDQRYQKPWLLILDNVEKIPTALPPKGGVILVTSAEKAVAARSFEISPFKLAESKDFLCKYLKEEQLDHLEELHKVLKGCPLLLMQVAKYLENSHEKLSDYLQKLNKKDLDQETFLLTLKKLTKISNEAMDFLKCCAFLNSEMDKKLFNNWRKEDFFKCCVQPLIDLSIFIETESSFNLHPLWQIVLRRRLEDGHEAREYFIKVVDLLTKQMEGFDYNKQETWDKVKRCIPHININEKLWVHVSVEKSRFLLIQAGIYLMMVEENASKALDYFNRALKISQKEGFEMAACFDNKAISLAKLGQYDEALNTGKKALKLRKNNLGEHHVDTAESYEHVGSILFGLKRYWEALRYHKKALEIRKELLGEQHKHTASSYNDIGLDQLKLGNPLKALKYHQKALEVRRKVLGEKNPDTAMSYSKEGEILCQLLQYDQGLKSLREALKIRQGIYGVDHPSTAPSYYKIGKVLCQLKQYGEGLDFLQQALEINAKIFGNEHFATRDVAEIIFQMKKKTEKIIIG